MARSRGRHARGKKPPATPTAMSTTRTASPEPRQRTPRRRASVRFLSRVLLRSLALLWRAWIWLADHLLFAPAAWAMRNPGRIARWVWSGLWRLAAVLGVGYLVFDRIYEISATVSSPASDPNDQFRLPFTITNNSHIFSIRHISWLCTTVTVDTDPPNTIANNKTSRGTESILAPGQAINFDCNVAGPTSHSIKILENKIIGATLEISFSYDADLFGWLWHRAPPPTRFTWASNSTSSQWIRGKIAK